MKTKHLILCLLMGSHGLFAQKDTTYHQHLLVKLAPLTYLGVHSAFQVGLETNLTKKQTIAFDYAYGNQNLAFGRTGWGYVEDEVSQRFRLEYRWYKMPFLAKTTRYNVFRGIELYHRTNTYPSTVTIGRNYSNTSFRYSYFQKSESINTYQVFGAFAKYGFMETYGEHFGVEAYGGVGISYHSNITKPYSDYNLGVNDRFVNQESPNNNKLTIFNYHNPSAGNLTLIDILLSVKISYRIF